MVGTHVNTKTKKINLQGKLRQRTKNRYYHYRLTVSNGIRKEFTLQTRDYDEAVKQASELDSIWLAPTKEVALAHLKRYTALELAVVGFAHKTAGSFLGCYSIAPFYTLSSVQFRGASAYVPFEVFSRYGLSTKCVYCKHRIKHIVANPYFKQAGDYW